MKLLTDAASTGQLDAQIADLQQQITTMSSRQQVLSGEIQKAWDKDTAAQETEHSRLSARITTAEGMIATLQQHRATAAEREAIEAAEAHRLAQIEAYRAHRQQQHEHAAVMHKAQHKIIQAYKELVKQLDQFEKDGRKQFSDHEWAYHERQRLAKEQITDYGEITAIDEKYPVPDTPEFSTGNRLVNEIPRHAAGLNNQE